MKTRTLTMAALAASVALGLAVQAHGQVVYPKVVEDVTGGAGSIDLSSGSGNDSATVAITATLNISTSGTQVAGTQNDITFDPVNAPIGKKAAGKPDCKVNNNTCIGGSNAGKTCTEDTEATDCPGGVCGIHKDATSFAFQPPNCSTNCTGARAIVLSTDNTDPIPSGSVMYTCNVVISAAAPNGTYPLTISNILGSNPAGDPVALGGKDGAVTVPGVTPTGAPTATPTSGGPTKTPTAVITSTRVRPTSGFKANDDDACAIVSPANSQAGWMLVLPAALLLWVRRRSR
jgi:hypothetical protein